MKWLNYHHLFYFYSIVKEGSVRAAADKLLLTQPTLSAQIKKFENNIEAKLFTKKGKRLVPTETGRIVFNYAHEIFSLGDELKENIASFDTLRTQKLRIGVCDVVPKQMTALLLDPVFEAKNIFVSCIEGKLENLFHDLADGRLDLVLSDVPIMPHFNIKAFNHVLTSSTISIFGDKKKYRRQKQGFPKKIDSLPLLLPTQNTSLRRSLEDYFESNNLNPNRIGEFEDSALVKTLAMSGRGVFFSPTILEASFVDQYSFTKLFEIRTVKASYYAVSLERRIKDPAIKLIVENLKGMRN
jgi:LysR family transcriptional activator of nhaA